MGRLGPIGHMFGGSFGQVIGNNRSHSNSNTERVKANIDTTQSSPYEYKIFYSFIALFFSIIFFLAAIFEPQKQFFSYTTVLLTGFLVIVFIGMTLFFIIKDTKSKSLNIEVR